MGTIDGLNLVIIQVLYSGQRAGNLGRPEVNEWKFDKKFLIINNVCANNKIFEICKYFLKIILKIIKFIFNKNFSRIFL